VQKKSVKTQKEEKQFVNSVQVLTEKAANSDVF